MVQWLLLTYYLLEWRQVNSFLLNSTKGFGTLKENNKNPFFLFCNKGRQRLSYWVRSFYIAVFVLFINFILLDRETKYYSSVYEQEIDSNSSSFVDQTCRHDIQLVILPVIQSPKIKQKILLKVYTFFGRSDHSLEGLIILWKVWSFFGRSDHERTIIETTATTWKFFSFRMKNHIFHSSNVNY